MAQAGEWEQVGIRIVPIGTKYRVAVQSILEVLGYSDPADSGTGRSHPPPAITQAPGNGAGSARSRSRPAGLRRGACREHPARPGRRFRPEPGTAAQDRWTPTG